MYVETLYRLQKRKTRSRDFKALSKPLEKERKHCYLYKVGGFERFNQTGFLN
jgi:hypothetical protein